MFFRAQIVCQQRCAYIKIMCSFYLHLVAGDAISAPSHPSLAQAELQKGLPASSIKHDLYSAMHDWATYTIL